MNDTEHYKNQIYILLNKLISDKLGLDIVINQVDIKCGEVFININNFSNTSHKKTLRFLKDIFKFKQYKTIQKSTVYYDISFVYTDETFKYLDRIMVFQ